MSLFLFGTNSQLSVDGFLLHDLHDGCTSIRAAFGRGVNCDGLLCCSCVFFPVDVDPGVKRKTYLYDSFQQGGSSECLM